MFSINTDNFSIEAAVIICAVSVPQLRPLVRYLRRRKISTVGKKHTYTKVQRYDAQNLLQARRSHESQQDYKVKVWNTSPPAEDDPSFIRLPDRIFRATDLQVNYSRGGRSLPGESVQTFAL